jgi:hypothetical protein
LKFNQKPDVNARIFLDDIRTIILPYIDTLLGLAVNAQEIAILLKDNFLTHVSDDVIHILTAQGCAS